MIKVGGFKAISEALDINRSLISASLRSNSPSLIYLKILVLTMKAPGGSGES
jgi:hypothetical protein